MKTAIQRIGAAIRRIKNAYNNDIIAYPRVSNNYTNGDTELFPHPPIEQFDEFSGKLHYKLYPVVKDAIPIELSNKGISTPATIEGIMEWLDKYYDDDMKPIRSEMMRDINRKLENFEKHLSSLSFMYDPSSLKDDDGKITANSICRDGYVSNRSVPVNTYIVKRKLTPALKTKIDTARRYQKAGHKPEKKIKDRTENINTIATGHFIEFDFFEGAVEHFKNLFVVLDYFNKRDQQHARRGLLKQKEDTATKNTSSARVGM